MPYCDECGNYVSKSFKRVFEVDGELLACPNCSPWQQTDETVIERM